jgi:PAS domain S-box-containing protein
MTVDLRLIGTLTLCAVLLCLALVVVARDPRALVNRLFALSMLTIIGWTGSISLYLSTRDYDPNIFLGRLGFASAAAIPFSLLWMFESLDDTTGQRLTKPLRWAGTACALFVTLSLTPLIVAGSAQASSGRNFIYGPLHPLFGVYFLSAFALALYRLFKRLRSASGMRRLQLRYLLLGILLGGIGGTTTNLVIPIVWGTSKYSLLGPYFTLFMAGFAAHAIIRYRLMDIRVVIKSGVVYASGIAVAVSLFVGFTILFRVFTRDQTDTISFAVAVAIAVVTAVLFQPLNTLLRTLLDRYLYRRSYDYQRTIRDATRRLSTILDPIQLLRYLSGAIEGILKVERACVYLRNDAAVGPLNIVATSGQWAPDTAPRPISSSSALLTLLEREKRPFVRDDVISSRNLVALNARRELRQLDGEVALPFVEDKGVSGFLLVGPKLSGDPYFPEDLDLMSTLVSQATIALQNAKLYRQVVIANEYIQNILSTMESGVIAVAADGTVTLFNAAAEEMTQLQAEELRGKSLSRLPTPLAEALRDAATGGDARTEIEMSIQNRAGHLVPIISSSSTLRDRSGAVLGAVAVFSDLSRLKELEREKQRAERLASVGALASGIAHEIKNPLVAIKTFAELLPERFTDEDFHGDFSKVVVREIERIDDLVARLRGLTPTAQRLVALDVLGPIRETLVLLRGQFEQAHIVVTTSFEPHLPRVAGDANQLKQLFLNVCGNAVEAMTSGGQLDVRVMTQRILGSTIVTAEFEDTGGGIPAALLPKIFDPFVTSKERGSGLGLSICRGIADAHRATISATNSANGRGAILSIEFPALPYDASDPLEAVEPRDISLNKSV